jgi:tryptophan-rich sensory protein
MSTKTGEAVKLVLIVVACQFVGVAGAFFTCPAIAGWYAALRKPSFNPPNWVFGPVWVTLYLLMGIALWLVLRGESSGSGRRLAVGLFAVQLALNALWSPAFFGLHSPLAGLFVILPLWLAILLTVRSFLRTSRAAGILLLPYLLWVSYAVALNIAIFILNR